MNPICLALYSYNYLYYLESLAEKYHSTYTYMKEEVEEGQEVVIIVRRHKNESMQPDSDVKLFPKRLSTNVNTTSKLYIYNALKNSKHHLAGKCRRDL